MHYNRFCCLVGEKKSNIKGVYMKFDYYNIYSTPVIHYNHIHMLCATVAKMLKLVKDSL